MSREKLAIHQRIWRRTRVFWPMLSYTETRLVHQPQSRMPPVQIQIHRTCQAGLGRHIALRPVKRYHKFILPRYTTPPSPKTIRDPEVSNLQTFFPRYVPILPLPTPFPPPHPLLSPGARWRLQKCTITGLTHITRDTIQLPQALSISRI